LQRDRASLRGPGQPRVACGAGRPGGPPTYPLLRPVRYRVDLHLDVRYGELAGYRGARRPGLSEELRVHFVHGGEILAVGEVDAALYNVRQAGAACLQDALDVLNTWRVSRGRCLRPTARWPGPTGTWPET